MFALANLIANIFGLDFATARKWASVLLVGVCVLVFLIIGSLVWKACNKPPKLDEQEIQKGEQAVKERNDAQLKEILVNADVREAAIDANVSGAKADAINARAESRARYANMNTSELAAELERRK